MKIAILHLNEPVHVARERGFVAPDVLAQQKKLK
jgi:hypothetical protein